MTALVTISRIRFPIDRRAAAARGVAASCMRRQRRQPRHPTALSRCETRSLAAQCAQCHGNRRPRADARKRGARPGRPAGHLHRRADEGGFEAAARTSTVMQQLAKGFNDAQVDQARALLREPAGRRQAHDCAAATC